MPVLSIPRLRTVRQELAIERALAAGRRESAKSARLLHRMRELAKDAAQLEARAAKLAKEARR